MMDKYHVRINYTLFLKMMMINEYNSQSKLIIDMNFETACSNFQ